MTTLVPCLVILAAILFVQRTFSNICDMHQMQKFIYFQKMKTCPHKIMMLGAVIDDFLPRISNLHNLPNQFGPDRVNHSSEKIPYVTTS